MGFRRTGFAPVCALLIPAFALGRAPPRFPPTASPHAQRSPTQRRLRAKGKGPRGKGKAQTCLFPFPFSLYPEFPCLRFGTALKPPSILGARTPRPVSCYALFQWWLLLSQHPGCLCILTSFYTQRGFRGLSGRSGLFPSRQRSLSPAVSLPSSAVTPFGV